MRSGGFRNSAMADGRWHSFGAGSSFAGRGVGNFAGSRFGGERFAGNRFGFRGRGFGFDRFGFHRFGFGFGRPFFGFGLGLGGWGCGWGWPYWDWGWGCPGYWGLGWGYPGWGPYGYGNGPDGYDDAWVWDNSDTGNYSDYTGDANVNMNPNYSDDSVYSNAPNDDEQAEPDTTQTQPGSSNPVDPESIPTVVYLKDGTTLQMTAYWSSGNTLHYVNGQGGVSRLDVSQIDLQRTVDENAKHGVRFPIQPQRSTTVPSAPAMTASPSAPAAAIASSVSKTA